MGGSREHRAGFREASGWCCAVQLQMPALHVPPSAPVLQSNTAPASPALQQPSSPLDTQTALSSRPPAHLAKPNEAGDGRPRA